MVSWYSFTAALSITVTVMWLFGCFIVCFFPGGYTCMDFFFSGFFFCLLFSSIFILLCQLTGDSTD